MLTGGRYRRHLVRAMCVAWRVAAERALPAGRVARRGSAGPSRRGGASLAARRSARARGLAGASPRAWPPRALGLALTVP